MWGCARCQSAALLRSCCGFVASLSLARLRCHCGAIQVARAKIQARCLGVTGTARGPSSHDRPARHAGEDRLQVRATRDALRLTATPSHSRRSLRGSCLSRRSGLGAVFVVTFWPSHHRWKNRFLSRLLLDRDSKNKFNEVGLFFGIQHIVEEAVCLKRRYSGELWKWN